MSYRVGTGFDAHRLVPGRPLVLGGITIEHELGLEGHSDADIVCHALIDALLGAAALGDIGDLFPPDDARFARAASIDLLELAWTQVSAAGFSSSTAMPCSWRRLRRSRRTASRCASGSRARSAAGRPGLAACHGNRRAGLHRTPGGHGLSGGRAARGVDGHETSVPRSIASSPSTQMLASAMTPSMWIVASLSPP